MLIVDGKTRFTKSTTPKPNERPRFAIIYYIRKKPISKTYKQ
jgi:hypothetical protein